MKTDSFTLLQQLLQIAEADLQTVQSFTEMSTGKLNYNPALGVWSALQCLEHLNLYAAFYLPEIEKALAAAGAPRLQFKSGVAGNLLVTMVIPKEGSKKMKTFSAMEPRQAIGQKVLDTFIFNQQQLIVFLRNAATTNLNCRSVAVTFTRLIKLRLGDGLRFMVHHHNRHILQAKRALATA